MAQFTVALYCTPTYRTDIVVEAIDLIHAEQIGKEIASTIDLDDFDLVDTEYTAEVPTSAPNLDERESFGDTSAFVLELAATDTEPTKTVAYVETLLQMSPTHAKVQLPGQDDPVEFDAPEGRTFTIRGPVWVHVLEDSEGPIPGSSEKGVRVFD